MIYNWGLLKLEDLSTKITDGTHKTPRYLEKGIPFISTVNLVPFANNFDYSKYQKYISKEEHKELTKRTRVDKGDILLSKCGTIGRAQAVRVNYEFSIFVGLMLIKVNQSKMFPKYLEYWLNQGVVERKLKALSTGASRATLPISAVYDLEIPLPLKNNQPDVEEQKRIVDKIDRLFAEIDQGIKSAETSIEGSKQLFLSEIETIAKQKEDEYWKWVRLGDFVEVKGGKRIPRGQKFSGHNTEHRYIRVTDMKNMTVDESGVKYISREIYSLLKNYSISKDDLYLSIAGTIGKAGVVPDVLDGSILTENAVRLIYNKDAFDKKYLSLMLNSLFVQHQIIELIKKMGQPKLAIFRLKEINMPMFFVNNKPNIEKQKEVVQKLNKIIAFSKSLESHSVNILNDLQNLKQSILNQAFQGKL